MEDSNKIEMMELLAKHEETIDRLYMTYAARFPEKSRFWEELAKEQNSHAAWIRMLESDVSDGYIDFDPGKYEKAAINSSIKFMEDKINEARNDDFTLVNALSIALDIEKSFIERTHFNFFGGELGMMKEVFEDLKESAGGHIDKIERELYREKFHGT
ncbi:MAG: hypothetical protein M1269_03450 [Chloroflexi bacterium]|nr:hypothetical protein [Chloroflexota bacterium]